MTERFVSAAEMMRRVLGMPDYKFAVIAPWFGSKTKAVTAAIGACVDCEPPKG